MAQPTPAGFGAWNYTVRLDGTQHKAKLLLGGTLGDMKKFTRYQLSANAIFALFFYPAFNDAAEPLTLNKLRQLEHARDTTPLTPAQADIGITEDVLAFLRLRRVTPGLWLPSGHVVPMATMDLTRFTPLDHSVNHYDADNVETRAAHSLYGNRLIIFHNRSRFTQGALQLSTTYNKVFVERCAAEASLESLRALKRPSLRNNAPLHARLTKGLKLALGQLSGNKILELEYDPAATGEQRLAVFNPASGSQNDLASQIDAAFEEMLVAAGGPAYRPPALDEDDFARLHLGPLLAANQAEAEETEEESEEVVVVAAEEVVVAEVAKEAVAEEVVAEVVVAEEMAEEVVAEEVVVAKEEELESESESGGADEESEDEFEPDDADEEEDSNSEELVDESEAPVPEVATTEVVAEAEEKDVWASPPPLLVSTPIMVETSMGPTPTLGEVRAREVADVLPTEFPPLRGGTTIFDFLDYSDNPIASWAIGSQERKRKSESESHATLKRSRDDESESVLAF